MAQSVAVRGCPVARRKHARTLQELPKERRHPAIVADITDASQTDRSVAIIGAAYVDLVLRDAISARFERREPELLKLIFENRGPLDSFGARIQIGYALGLFSEGVYDDLRAIKEIRNSFAHAAEAIDFEDPLIAQHTAHWNLTRIGFQGRDAPTTSRGRYVHAVEMVTDCLFGDMSRRARGLPPEHILHIPSRKVGKTPPE